jgi:hypothetical protein
MMNPPKIIIFLALLFSFSLNADTNKDPIVLVTVTKPELEGFSTTGVGGLIGAATIPYVGEILGRGVEAGLSEEKYTKDFNAFIQSAEVTGVVINQIKSALIESKRFSVSDETYTEDHEIKYENWLDKKDRLSSNSNDYILEVGIGKIRLEDQFIRKILRAEFAIKIINKNEVIKTQSSSLGDFLFKWEMVDTIKDEKDRDEVKKAYLETLNKLSNKLAKELVDKI